MRILINSVNTDTRERERERREELKNKHFESAAETKRRSFSTKRFLRDREREQRERTEREEKR